MWVPGLDCTSQELWKPEYKAHPFKVSNEFSVCGSGLPTGEENYYWNGLMGHFENQWLPEMQL